jgi:hypothetical protein
VNEAKPALRSGERSRQRLRDLQARPLMWKTMIDRARLADHGRIIPSVVVARWVAGTTSGDGGKPQVLHDVMAEVHSPKGGRTPRCASGGPARPPSGRSLDDTRPADAHVRVIVG